MVGWSTLGAFWLKLRLRGWVGGRLAKSTLSFKDNRKAVKNRYLMVRMTRGGGQLIRSAWPSDTRFFTDSLNLTFFIAFLLLLRVLFSAGIHNADACGCRVSCDDVWRVRSDKQQSSDHFQLPQRAKVLSHSFKPITCHVFIVILGFIGLDVNITRLQYLTQYLTHAARKELLFR